MVPPLLTCTLPLQVSVPLTTNRPVPATMMSIVVSSSGDVPHAALVPAATVTMCVVATVTLSPSTGATPPTHVPPSAQLPLVVLVIAATRQRLRVTAQVMVQTLAFGNVTEMFSGTADVIGSMGNSTLKSDSRAPVPSADLAR